MPRDTPTQSVMDELTETLKHRAKRDSECCLEKHLCNETCQRPLCVANRRITELERYKSAFFRVGAEIAKASCCGPADTEGCSLGQLHNCTRERLMVVFLNERRALGNE